MTNRCQRLPRPTRVLVLTFSVALMGASALLDEEPQVAQGSDCANARQVPAPRCWMRNRRWRRGQ